MQWWCTNARTNVVIVLVPIAYISRIAGSHCTPKNAKFTIAMTKKYFGKFIYSPVWYTFATGNAKNQCIFNETFIIHFEHFAYDSEWGIIVSDLKIKHIKARTILPTNIRTHSHLNSVHLRLQVCLRFLANTFFAPSCALFHSFISRVLMLAVIKVDIDTQQQLHFWEMQIYITGKSPECGEVCINRGIFYLEKLLHNLN